MDINDIDTTVTIHFALLHTNSLHLKFTLLNNNKFYLFRHVLHSLLISWCYYSCQPPEITWNHSKQLSHDHFKGSELGFYCTCVKILP